MKLYYSPGACSLSPHIVLHESGLPFEALLASTKTHQLADGTDFYTINPLGYVPVLQISGGTLLREGPVIVQYIADQVADKGLLAAPGSLERYRTLEWLNFIATELHKSHGPLFTPGTPEDYKPIVRAQLRKRFAWVDGELAQRSYLMGETFTVADAYLFTVARWGQYVGVDTADLAHLQAYCARVQQRPAVQAALRAEGLIKS